MGATVLRTATAADYPAYVRLFTELRVPDPTPSLATAEVSVEETR